MATLIVNISKGREETITKLDALCKKLGCRRSDLLWSAIDDVLAKPPKVAPAGAKPATGSACGYWVIHERDDSGRLIGGHVAFVTNRSEITGAAFFRSKDGEEKMHKRALKQAKAALAYDFSLVGITKKITVKNEPTTLATSIPAPAAK